MRNLFRTHPYRTSGAAAILLVGIAWLAVGYFGVHTFFVDDVVSEAAPAFDAPAPSTDPNATTPSSSAGTPAASAPSAPLVGDTSSPGTSDAAPPSVPPQAEIVTEHVGSFVDEAHPTSGRAVVLGNGSGQRFLRFEEFATDNGPDLNVYLVNSATGDVSDFVDLGDLKGNIGEQNYEIPAEVDLTVYDRVVIWCVRFGVGFGNATLTSA